MNLTETRQLLSFVSAACPQQRIEPLTHQAWQVLLANVGYEDAYRAAACVGRRSRFINPDDIVAEVRLWRAGRIPGVRDPGVCGEHLGQWAGSCGPCRSERIGRMDA